MEPFQKEIKSRFSAKIRQRHGPSPHRQGLIPRLQEDLVLECLIRVPVPSHRNLIRVCKRWRELLLDRNSYFYRKRSQLGLVQPAIFLISNISGVCQDVHIKSHFNFSPGLCPYKSLIFAIAHQASHPNEIGKPITDFLILDTLTRQIWRGPNMLFRPANSAFGVLNDRLYVVGGHAELDYVNPGAQWLTSRQTTRQCQCYDISSNKWSLISPLPFRLDIISFNVYHDMFTVYGPNSEDEGKECWVLCYSDKTDSWIVYTLREYMDKLQEIEEANESADDDDSEEESEEHDSDTSEEEAEPGNDGSEEEAFEAHGPNTAFCGVFIGKIASDADANEGFKWNNMGDVMKLLQSQTRRVTEPHPDAVSLLPHDVLPSILMIHDEGESDEGTELNFRAELNIVQLTKIKAPHHSLWKDTRLLFYPVCQRPTMSRDQYLVCNFILVCY